MSIESHLTLGQYLRHERERRGLTIEQVASATKIGIRTLHALEGDHYAELPAKPFIRGFVISYSRFVGLDHKEALTHFNAFLDDRVQQERPNREGGHSGYAFEKREGDQSRTILGITMGGFVLVGAVAMIFLKPSLKHHHGSHLDKLRAGREGEVTSDAEPSATPSGSVKEAGKDAGKETTKELAGPVRPGASPSPGSVTSERSAGSVVAAGSVATPSAKPSPLSSPSSAPSAASAVSVATASPTPAPAPSPSAAPTSAVPDPLNSGFGLKPSETAQRVVCKALDSVWVRYRVDDKPLMQFVLKKDKVLVLRGKQSVVLQVGEPDHLNISVNGGPYHDAASDKNNVERQDDATLFFPSQLAKNTQEPFQGESALSARKSPSSPPPSDDATSHP